MMNARLPQNYEAPSGVAASRPHGDAAADDASLRGDSRRFYILFVICLVLVSVPIKNFAYLVPPLYLFLLLVGFDVVSGLRTLFILCVVGALSATAICLDSLGGRHVNVPGLFMGLFTYLTLFLAVGHRYDRPFDEALADRLTTVVSWFVIVQSTIGVVQFAVSGNPDTVAGTFGLFDFLTDAVTIAQVYFTFTIFGMLLFLMMDLRRPLARWALAFGLFACVLAQSGHQTIFFAAAFALFSILAVRRLGTVVQGVAVVAVLAALVVQFYPATYELSLDWYRKVVKDPDSPKWQASEGGRAMLQNPQTAMLGTGLGQFSSRAALITSGEYLRRPLPEIIVAKSDYFVTALDPTIEVFAELGEGSALSKPYFSLLSIPTEWGLPLTLLASCILLGHLLRNFRRARSSSPRLATIGRLSCVGLVFFILCCAIENYAEFPRAIFLPVLLYAAAQARAVALERELEVETAAERVTTRPNWAVPGVAALQQ